VHYTRKKKRASHDLNRAIPGRYLPRMMNLPNLGKKSWF
jgi:hypothetical protein